MGEWWSGDGFETIQSEVAEALPGIATGLLLFILFLLGGMLLRRIVIRAGEVRGVDPDLSRFLGKAAQVGLVLFGIVTALGTMGVDVAALVAGLGLTGFAIGFALKDIVSNIMAGILIMLYRPFDRGDKIKVSGFEGIVQQIDLRYTLLDSVLEQQGQKIFVPNSLLFTNAITVEENAAAKTPKTEAG